MPKFLTRLFATLAVVFAVMATPAMAQATRTWVSGVGDDANPCSRTAPCRTFAGAISKTAAAGEINALDPGSFGAVTITKSITLKSDGLLAGILVSGTSAIIINAGANDRVVIDGLDIDGLSNGTSGAGIVILSARDVIVRNTSVRGFNAQDPSPLSGSGIAINAPVNKVTLQVENSFIFNNTKGIAVIGDGLNGSARIYNSQIVRNIEAGIRVSGTGNTAQISNVVIDRTAKSLDIVAGGAVFSFGDNILSPGDAPTIAPKG